MPLTVYTARLGSLGSRSADALDITRRTARKFYRGELRVFPDAERPEGYALQDIDGPFRFFQCTFRWQVVEVVDVQAAIRLYLDINTAGTPHTAEEIDRVRAMLARQST